MDAGTYRVDGLVQARCEGGNARRHLIELDGLGGPVTLDDNRHDWLFV